MNCPYCKKLVKHKTQCKKYTKELEDIYNKQQEEAAIAATIVAAEKAKLDEEIEKVRQQFPFVVDHFQKRLEQLEYRISELESELEPCPPYCECQDCMRHYNTRCNCEEC